MRRIRITSSTPSKVNNWLILFDYFIPTLKYDSEVYSNCQLREKCKQVNALSIIEVLCLGVERECRSGGMRLYSQQLKRKAHDRGFRGTRNEHY
jgi:hypothetical protein